MIGGVEDAPMFSSQSIPGVGVIDLDATELPSNDREIFDAMMECVFANPAILEAEVPGAATSVAPTSPVWRLCRTPPCQSS
jgi:hypothetical protein